MYMDSKIEEDDDEDEEAVFDLDGEVCIIFLYLQLIVVDDGLFIKLIGR